MFTGQLFQLLDKDDSEIGIIYTSDMKVIPNNLEDLWQEYVQSFQPDADEFVLYLNDKFSNTILFERVYLNETFA